MVLAIGGAVFWNGQGLYTTAVGEQRVIQLADGSNVSLDTDSRIRVRFAGAERRLELERGQALFDVADDGRPFVVVAGDTSITAVGTVFDVRRHSDGVKVTLVSGVVDVAGKTAAAQTPIAARAATTCPRSAATAPPTDISAMPARPMIITFLRPYRSPRWPKASSNPANVSV